MKDLKQLVERANAPLTTPSRNISVGRGAPRFELYHFAFSLCSQKVRLCLAEKPAAYLAHDINLEMPLLGNYDPGYVQLRLAAKESSKFASEYTGRSSVQSEGFDPAVVPTLVDHEAELVVADSLAICRYIDRVVTTGQTLIPEHLDQKISAELAIVDATPHVALLYGGHPEFDFRPDRIRNVMAGVHDRKIEKIRAARDLVLENETLLEAFDAKIAKETAAKTFVANASQMRDAIDEIIGIVADLDVRLADRRIWICGDQLTMADLMWAVSLFRLKWLGAGFSWSGGHPLNEEPRPNVSAYAGRLFARPCFRSAIVDWPGIIRSEFVTDHYTD